MTIVNAVICWDTYVNLNITDLMHEKHFRTGDAYIILVSVWTDNGDQYWLIYFTNIYTTILLNA